MFKHFGRMCGAGAGTGVDDDAGALLEFSMTEGIGVAVGAMHLVQIVEVTVLKIVDVVTPVETLLIPAEVRVCVTGQTVIEAVVLENQNQSCTVTHHESWPYITVVTTS